ncbi:hypothetical protein [Calidithermus chliarophilus]|uniref:hypothetical protein n=1 Tax=Calidithermus chliarophilus TaxID=52023 RepID=UPI000404C120|nr:hypothetical protein [Calidithermus chliarophilus]
MNPYRSKLVPKAVFAAALARLLGLREALGPAPAKPWRGCGEAHRRRRKLERQRRRLGRYHARRRR